MIVFENKPSTKTPINKDNLNANFSELKEDIEYLNSNLTTEILYEDNIGTTGSINFSKSLSNFKYIDVYGYDSTSTARLHKRVESPGTGIGYFCFSEVVNAEGVNAMVFKTKTYNLSENKIEVNAYGRQLNVEVNVISNSISNSNRDETIYISKIVGYK